MSIISEALKKVQERHAKIGVVKDLSGIFSAKSPEDKKLEEIKIPSPKRPVLVTRIIFVTLIVGSLVLLMFFANYLKSFQAKTSPDEKKETASRRPASTPVKKSRTTPAAIFRDRALRSKSSYPTRPIEQAKTTDVQQFGIYERPEDMPAVSGIMYSPTNPQAIVDGELVSEGDSVRDFKIKKILTDRIKVIYEGREYEVRLR